MSVSNFIAVRVGEKIPQHYRKIGKHAMCSQCGATFSIIHAGALADETLAADQIEEVQRILAGEHVDEKFVDHLKTYGLDRNSK